MPTNIEIAERLKKLRKLKGLTQYEVSQSIGVSLSAITNYELGTRIPRDEIKIRFANFYKVSVGSIFFD